AHAPLRRLSEAALSACSEADLLAALAAEARGALAVDDVEVMAAAAPVSGAAHVAATARPLALDEPRIAVELGAERATRLAARSALLVPIGWGGDVRHVVVLARRAAHVWALDEILIAETLANQAALGLAREESERRRVAQAERDRALARSAHALNVSLELQAVLDTLAREADLAVGGEMAGVYLLEDDGTALATAGHNCPDGWLGYRLAPGEGIAGRVLESGRPVMTSDYDGDITLPRNIVLRGVRSGVGVPMRWNGELRGALSIGFLVLREFTNDDLSVLEAIADLAVVACHNAEAFDDVRTAASTDALTGLLNHGAMHVRVREEIARAKRDGQPLCCVLIDLDDFKRVNDEFGHPAGDALLRRVADSLRAEVRPYDQVARYGGDEFVLVLPGTEDHVARAVAERVRRRVRDGAPRVAGSAIGNCSIGVSAWEPGMTADDLLAAADRALLLAKRTGKGRVAVANPDAEEELTRLQQSDASPAAVEALAAAIDARDNYRNGHSDEVVRLATGVAMLLGLPADAVERVGHGALLHDVGKLAIPPEILQKDGVLDDAEWKVMAEHPVIGEGILRRIPQLAPLAPIVRHEHEHWDGSGYPDGLSGRRIPIGSRIILACDAYAAMTTERPYRRALWKADAVAELRARAGTQFDPAVVEALLDLLGV
ncbi:MAG TPA: diguanylate cyclase, partial [Solirubrobacteraceae bacterium]|nr:diguanylate cyclase [Solirubrobacteraceae bacterium]